MITRYRQRFPSAMNGMEETLEACLQVLRLPEAHHKRLRTSNLLERTFGELKRRTKVIPHFFTEQAAIKLSFAVLLATASKWRGVRMDVFTIRRIEELRNEFLPKSTSEETSSLTEPGEPYGDLTGKLGLDRLDEHLELLRCYYNFVRPHGALKFGREIRTPAMQAGLTIRRLTFRDIFLATTIPLWARTEVFLLTGARNPVSSAPVPLPAAA